MEPSNPYLPPVPPPPHQRPAWVKLLIVLVGIAVIASAVALATKQQEKRERQRAALESIERVGEEVRNDMRKGIESKDGLTVQQGVEALDKVQRNLAKGAALGGEEGKTMKVVAEYMGELQVRTKRYADAAAKMGEDNAFDLAQLTSKEAIAKRKDMAKELMALNVELGAFFKNGEVRFRQLLQNGGISGTKVDEMVKGFTDSQARALPMQQKVRECDDIIWKALIEFCDLLDKEWGKWENTKDGPRFESDAVVAKYNEIVARAVKAGEEQTKAQRQMLQMPRK